MTDIEKITKDTEEKEDASEEKTLAWIDRMAEKLKEIRKDESDI